MYFKLSNIIGLLYLLFYAMFSCNSNSALEFFCHNCFALHNARALPYIDSAHVYWGCSMSLLRQGCSRIDTMGVLIFHDFKNRLQSYNKKIELPNKLVKKIIMLA